MRKDMGILHFFVNGVDQGPAAFNIPEHVFGIVGKSTLMYFCNHALVTKSHVRVMILGYFLDLYGRVAQATIVDCYMPPPFSPESPLSTESNATIYP